MKNVAVGCLLSRFITTKHYVYTTIGTWLNDRIYNRNDCSGSF